MLDTSMMEIIVLRLKYLNNAINIINFVKHFRNSITDNFNLIKTRSSHSYRWT